MIAIVGQPAKARLIWQIALTLSAMGWILTAGRIAIYLAGNASRHLDWQSVIIGSTLLLISTILCLRNLWRAR